mgnify:CR=1 FL=1
MFFIGLNPGCGSEVVLSLPRFRALTVLFAHHDKMPQDDPDCMGYGMRLKGAVVDEISVRSWPVGKNLYLSQPDTEITKGRDGLEQHGDFRERFHYSRILHGGAECRLVLPPHIGRLVIYSDQGFRDSGRHGEGPPVIKIIGSEDCPIPEIPIEINAAGVSLDTGDARIVSGLIRNPGDLHMTPEVSEHLEIKDAARRDWILEGSLQVTKMPSARV